MFRPATPLSLLVFVAFGLLLISVLSTPIVKGIKIANYQGVDFGVFGYCKGSVCSGVRIGYNPDGQLDSDAKIDFTLPANTRRSLSSLLIVHPIAALATLILLILAAAAHLHSPAHSPRYLLILMILMLPTFMLSLLAFLVDILLFVPHVQWGGWLVLAATIIIAISGIVTCGMRRALLSRKAHHKRIAENSEMNGETYYNQRAAGTSPLSPQPTAPVLSTSSTQPDQLPAFATFDVSRKETGVGINDDRIPLNPRDPTRRSPDGSIVAPPAFRGVQRVGTGSTTNSGRVHPSSDRSGGPPGPTTVFAASAIPSEPSSPRLPDPPGRFTPPSQAGTPVSMGGRGRGDYGRGDYMGDPRNGPRGRGGYAGPYRPPPGYGMMSDDGRGMGGPMGRGNPRGPMPGPGRGYGPAPYGMAPPYAREQTPPGGYPGRRVSPGPPSAPGYGPRSSPAPGGPPGYGPGIGYGGYQSREGSPGPRFMGPGPARGQASPAPPMPTPLNEGVVVGQAVEMDANTGSPSPAQTPFPPGQINEPRTTDSPSNALVVPNREHAGYSSPSSDYSRPESYVPARAEWGHNPRQGSPAIDLSRAPPKRIPSPVELPTQPKSRDGPSHARIGSGDNYYEDVDPRFAEDGPTQPVELAGNLPSDLHRPMNQSYPSGDSSSHPPSLPNDRSYEDIHEMARSPAHSDTSQYTSISQRGVNPQWQQQSGGPHPRSRPRPQQDFLLAGNSDFELRRNPGRGQSPPRGGVPGYLGPASAGGRYPAP
ncbi:MAG: hypothetical protein M1823_005482 [Watsoniomyces obsoletus]|nr:MAG: hypothetical protein M1823_005482 [Watsoniomyces obsoletus]